MYNTKHICTYYDDDIFDNELNVISDNDKEFVKNALYRNDILYIFELEDFDLDVINDKLDDLYEKIKECNELNSILKKASNIYLSEDLQMGLLLLFTFDFLYLAHPCISEYLEKKTISKENLDKLDNIISNFIN